MRDVTGVGPEDRRLWLRWAPTFLGFPVGGALAHAVAGPVDGVGPALVEGLLAGTVVGAGQWLALRRRLGGGSWAWVVATAAGMATGLGAGVALAGYPAGAAELALVGAASGAGVGGLQALVLRGRVAQAWPWALAVPPAWAVGWLVTRAAGVDLSPRWPVFGASGAVVCTALTGIGLAFLLRDRAIGGEAAPTSSAGATRNATENAREKELR